MSKGIQKLTLGATGAYLALAPALSLAVEQGQQAPDITGAVVDPPATVNDAQTVSQLISKVALWILGFAGAIAVVVLIIGGLQYVTSAGNEKRVDAAKKTILYAVVGLIVIVLAFVIVSFVARNASLAVSTT